MKFTTRGAIMLALAATATLTLAFADKQFLYRAFRGQPLSSQSTQEEMGYIRIEHFMDPQCTSIGKIASTASALDRCMPAAEISQSMLYHCDDLDACSIHIFDNDECAGQMSGKVQRFVPNAQCQNVPGMGGWGYVRAWTATTKEEATRGMTRPLMHGYADAGCVGEPTVLTEALSLTAEYHPLGTCTPIADGRSRRRVICARDNQTLIEEVWRNKRMCSGKPTTATVLSEDEVQVGVCVANSHDASIGKSVRYVCT